METSMPAGTYTVEFKDVTGWNTPPSQSVTITAGQTTRATVTYTVARYTVTATASTGGSVTPDSRTVNHGGTTTFTVTPDTGYTATIDGTCGGTLIGNTYTTSPITEDCTVNATFTLNQYEITASAGAGGSIAPDSRTVGHGSTTTFTITPDTGYHHGSVNGTCPSGSFTGNTYTTGAIIENCTVTASFVGDFAGGDGSADSPYRITTVAHLNNVRNMQAGDSFVLSNDLNLNVTPWNANKGWLPIGTATHPFRGSFDGGGYLIQNLFIDRLNENDTGLFGIIGVQGRVHDLGLSNVHVVGRSNVGGLAGRNEGTLERVHVDGIVAGAPDGDASGGLAGRHSGSVLESYANADVTGFGTAGGLVGISDAGVIENCFASGVVAAVNRVGGLAGFVSGGRARYVYATGLIAPAGDSGSAGGLVAETAEHPIIEHAFWNTDTTEQVTSAAGVGLTTAQLRDRATYTGWNLNPDGIWNQNVAIHGGYPYLTFAFRHTVSATVTPVDSAVITRTGAYPHGTRAYLDVLPAAGYRVDSATGCHGTLSNDGNIYITSSITGNCSVSFSFVHRDYTVTATAGTGGSVTPDSRTVHHGNTTTFTVTPDTGYRHDSVGGTCPSGSFDGNTYTTGVITSACSVSFSFLLRQYTVTPSAGANGAILPNTPQTVNHGETKSFTITPDEGYTATVGGTCGGTLSGNTYTTSPITEDCTVSATFALKQYTITPSAGTGGSVTPSSRTVTHGSSTTFTVTPDTGYRNGTVDGTCPAGSFSDNTYTTGSITESCTVAFSFIRVHTVSASAGSGGSVAPTVQTVFHNTPATFTVTPNMGFEHSILSGTCPAGSFNGNTYTTGAVTGNCTIAFSFRPVQHTVSASAGPDGSVDPTSRPVGHGGTAVFTVTPDRGFVFGNVSGSCPPGAFSGTTYTTGTITSNCAVHFNFTRQQHSVTAAATTGGSVSPTSQTVGHGGAAGFTVTPQDGFSHGLVGGTCPAGSFSGNAYTTGAITADCSVQFNFTQTQHAVTASAGSGGSVLPTSLSVGHGGTATFSVTPHAGLAHGPVGGTCPAGSFSGNAYTTGAITERCSLHFSFTPTQHTVTAMAGSNGRVDPTSRTVGHGAPTTFTVIPNTGYVHGPVSSTCPAGNFSGNIYTTGSITANCTVSFSFRPENEKQAVGLPGVLMLLLGEE